MMTGEHSGSRRKVLKRVEVQCETMEERTREYVRCGQKGNDRD
jgi:hypothetical protein